MRDPQIITFNGKQITYIDYSNLKDQEQIIKLIDKSCNLIRQQPGESVLSLMNVENMHFNKTVRSYLQNKVESHSQQVKRCAIYGLKGHVSDIYCSFTKFTGHNMKSFTNKEDALAYLTI